MSKKSILLNAFNMNCVGHVNHELWTHPCDTSAGCRKLSYQTDLAKLLERGLFDGLFITDTVGAYGVCQQSTNLTLCELIRLPVNDPLILVSAMADMTEHLGLGLTVNLTYEMPHLSAQRFSTFDHLIDGRVGWNVAMGYLGSAARAMGLCEQIAHDERYNCVDEFLGVIYQLWEGSWEDDTVLRDRATRVLAQPDKVHHIQHRGRYYGVEDHHLSEPSPQRVPVLSQTDLSVRGQAFAGQHVECVFLSGQSQSAACNQVAQLRRAVAQAGRCADDVRVFIDITAVAGKTEKIIREKLTEYQRYASAEVGLAHFSAGSGVGYPAYALDGPLHAVKTNTIEPSTRRAVGGDTQFMVRCSFNRSASGGRYVTIVGDAQQVTDALQQWVDVTDTGGFNPVRTVTSGSYANFIDLMMLKLRDRGVHKTGYAPGILRHKPLGTSRLPDAHPGAQRRWQPTQELVGHS